MEQKRVVFSRQEMYEMNKKILEERGVKLEDIAEIAYRQQAKYNPNLDMKDCLESVKKIISYRDNFHLILFSFSDTNVACDHDVSCRVQ